MMSIFVSTTAQEFMERIKFGPNNEVLWVNSKGSLALAGVVKGMILSSINGVPVVKANEEQRSRRHAGGELLLVFMRQFPGRHDEFDISSGDDEDSTCQQRSVPIGALPHEDVSALPKSTDVLIDAAKRAGPGKCIIIMCEGVNPAYAIAAAAEQALCTVMYINALARLKTRQGLEHAGDIFRKSLEKGLWICIEQATKSISLLRKLSECITEARSHNAIHEKTRLFLMCEPHPHFPEALLNGGVTLRSTLRGDTGELELDNNLLESRKGLSLVQGVASAGVDVKPEVIKKKRCVKISHEVSIVPLEKNTFLELSQSASPPADREPAHGDGITRIAKYSFGANEKFISLCKVGDGRYAVGTSGGYVFILDMNGLPLIQFRPHKACVWDVSFASSYDFSTACEDCTSSVFSYSLAGLELTATSVASFQSDVFAVTYAEPDDPNSAVLSGGLSSTICVLHSDRQTSSFIAYGVSIQAMCSTRRRQVLIGGGSGVCSLIDPAICITVEATDYHQRKVPAVASHGDIAVTGGFDKMVALWDVRCGFHLINERPMAEFITAVSVYDRHVAVCCGPDLLVWDIRKFVTPLATKRKAWNDLTRGIVMDGNTIVTASADGVARFWSFGSPNS